MLRHYLKKSKRYSYHLSRLINATAKFEMLSPLFYLSIKLKPYLLETTIHEIPSQEALWEGGELAFPVLDEVALFA